MGYTITVPPRPAICTQSLKKKDDADDTLFPAAYHRIKTFMMSQ